MTGERRGIDHGGAATRGENAARLGAYIQWEVPSVCPDLVFSPSIVLICVMFDPECYAILEREIERQSRGIELIPSENYVSPAVLEALGTEFTNKYSEGYPGRRYYGGQEQTDALESLAIERAKRIFRADHANVQALSGAAANISIYHAWLQPGDTVLGMDLSHGGHLTHGDPKTLAGRHYRFIRYGMKDVASGAIDYDALEQIAQEGAAPHHPCRASRHTPGPWTTGGSLRSPGRSAL